MCIVVYLKNTFGVNWSLFDDLTCLFGWWYRHCPILPCHFIWLNGQLTRLIYVFLLSNTRPDITGTKIKL